MQIYRIIKIVTLFIMLESIILADKTVIMTATVNQMLHSDLSIEELKALAIKKAKYAAATEIFGEFLVSETVMANGNIIDEIVREKSAGVIHVKGEPTFKNGKNLGDIQVTIEAYATDKDIKDTTPQPIVLNNFKYTNADVPMKSLKAMAEDAYIIQALSTKKPSIKNMSASEARKFAVSIDLTQMDFNTDTFTYTISGQIKYIPVFLRHADAVKYTSVDQRFKEKVISKPKKKGFYGLWSGYIMRTNGSSTQVEISITKSGQSKISFPMLTCGGDLLIQTKDVRYLEFKQLLNYGEDECQDKLIIKLMKVDDNQVQYKEYNEKNEKIAKGVLYRDEVE